MKLTTVLILCATLSVSAKGITQKVTLNMRDAPFATVLGELQKQTGYAFIYTETQLLAANNISVNVKNMPFQKALDICFSNQPLRYNIFEKTVVVELTDRPETNNKAESAATVTITGVVLGANDAPLAGATVKIKGSNKAVVTNEKGEFTISTAKGNVVLVVSFVGYEAKEVEAETNKPITITLLRQDNELNQIVIVGYGSQKKKDVTGAVSTLSSKDLEDRPNTQFGYAIEGKAAGVQIIRSSGQPQAGFSIRVRGTASITSASDPLYIVDGVPTYNTNEINPSDIESITILKDAASAAIYGTSGANGVVLITTKRGKNQKLKLALSTSAMFSTPWKKLDVLNGEQFKALATEMGYTTDWDTYNKNTNWQDEVFRTAVTGNYQLSATGGTAKTSYYVSGAIINQQGIVINNNLNRGTLKLNLDHQLTKFIKVGTSISYDHWNDKDVPENSRNGVITRLITTIPNIGIRDADDPEMYARSPFLNDLENPVSTVYQPDHLYKTNRWQGNVYAEATVVKGLKVKSLFGFEHNKGIYNSYQDSVQTRYGKSLSGIAAENDYKYNYWISENTATYSTKINNHSFDALGGFIVSREITDNLYLSSYDFTGAANTNVRSGNVQALPSPYYVRKSHASFIGRVNYSYKDKYMFTSNFRADGSGQFPQQNRWGYFPSFSVGWRISQEKFFQNALPFVNDLKIRAGWGLVGNDRATPYAWYGLIDTMSRYLINGNTLTAYTPTTLENTDLKWEKTSQTDIGIDLAILNSRVSITADYYYKKTTDMLLDVPQPASTGFTTALQNAGSLLNKGFEFSVSSKNIVHNNFTWNTDFNISFNHNKVLNIIGNTIPAGAVNASGDDFYTAIVTEGHALGMFYGKTSLGVDPETGDINFLQTADGSEDSIGIIGNANPKYVFGFTNNFRYKNFTLEVFFQGVQGSHLFNATRILSESMALAMNQSATVLKRWEKEGDVTNVPRATANDWTNAYPSTRFIENGSYVRLKALTLGYSVPAFSLAKVKVSQCKLYLTCENLLTFTKYSGYDPDVSAFSGASQSTTDQNTAPGVDFGTYPQSRDFIIGLNVTF
ncbi:TonB-dependent receptor [Parafilimonas sp.]|uniref:TonB-dependent receptor n=1 Tax=Parafilimonas sp. TaxID=1969739 RepID=UPI0039E56923